MIRSILKPMCVSVYWWGCLFIVTGGFFFIVLRLIRVFTVFSKWLTCSLARGPKLQRDPNYRGTQFHISLASRSHMAKKYHKDKGQLLG